MRCVLEALVTMQENFLGDIFTLDGELERVCHQRDVVLSAYPMSDNEAIEKVLDRGEIRPSLLRGNIRNISHPFLVGFFRCEISIQYVLVAMMSFHLACFLVGFAFSGYRTNMQLPHQSQNSFVIDRMPLLLQVERNTTIAIDLTSLQPGFLNQLHSFQIGVWFQGTFDPFVVGGS